MIYIVFLVIMILSPTSSSAHITQAVTYELSPGRFGDNLISYIHAKWISYKHGIPLLYKPFIHSDELRMHEQELSYAHHQHMFTKIIMLGQHKPVNLNHMSVLFVVPYFPESAWELEHGKSFTGGKWDSITIDWHDQKFIQLLRKTIQPRTYLAPKPTSEHRLTIALHMRKGGNHDTPETIRGFPLKFLPESFYFEQVKYIADQFPHQGLYIHIFTDDNNPQGIVERGASFLKNYDIAWHWRRQGNCDTAYVVEDFFLMQQFDCLIHSESNYSLLASKLGNYKISIFPDSFHVKDGHIVYDHISITTRE